MMKPVAIYIGRLSPDRAMWSLTDRAKFQWVKSIVSQFADYRFVLISESEIASYFTALKNITVELLPDYGSSGLSIYRHFNFRLSGLLKRMECSLFISLEGIVPKSFKGKIGLVLPERVSNEAKQKHKNPLDRYRARHLEKMALKADLVVCQSQFTKNYLSETLSFPENKLTVAKLYHPSNGFKALNWEEREVVKEKYSDGKEYLLYVGGFKDKPTFIRLLKALTILKKKMNSGMVLLLSGDKEDSFKKFPELVRTYHFRKDLQFTGLLTEEQEAALMGAAYACVIPSTETDFASPVVEMTHCYSPVVVPTGSVHQELGQQAVSNFEKEDFEDLGEKLCELYRNENKRAALIRAAEELSDNHKSPALKPILSELFNNLNKE